VKVSEDFLLQQPPAPPQPESGLAFGAQEEEARDAAPSPAKVALQQPVAAGLSTASAQQLAGQAAAVLEAGRPQQARPLLLAALQRCPLQQLETADTIISLLLEAEGRLMTSSSRSGSSGKLEVQQEGGPAPAGAGGTALEPSGGSPAASGSAAVQRELRLAMDALGRRVGGPGGMLQLVGVALVAVPSSQCLLHRTRAVECS
jgi:hypothetical protein